MRPRQVGATVWRWLGHIGTAAWLWSIGGGAIFATVLRSVTALSWPWIAILAIGVGCLILALIVTYGETRRKARLNRSAEGSAAGSEAPEVFVRAGWKSVCEPVSESLAKPFGRGVRLAIETREGEERDLRCIVTAPDGTRYRSVRCLDGFRISPTSSDMYHWPGEFEPKPRLPWAPGYYPYIWSGDTADIADDRSEILARQFFYVDEAEVITCHREGGSDGRQVVEARPTGHMFANDLARDEGVAVEVRLLSGERLLKGVHGVGEQEGSITLYDPQVMGDRETTRKIRLDQVASVTVTDVLW